MKKTILLMCAWLCVVSAWAQTTAREWFDMALAETNTEKKIEYYSKAIQLDPKDADAYNNRGVAKNNLGRYAEAIADFDKAIELNSKSANAYSHRGFSKHRLGHSIEGLIDLDIAIQLKSNYAAGYNRRGKVKFDLEQYVEAIADYDEAVKIAGYFHNPIWKYREAATKKLLSQGITPPAVVPPTANDWYEKANEEENKEKKIEYYTEAIQLNPTAGYYYRQRGDAKQELGRYAEAIADYDKVIELNPNDMYIHDPRGEANLKLGYYIEAMADYDNLVKKIALSSAIVYSTRGKLKKKLGRYTEAIDEYSHYYFSVEGRDTAIRSAREVLKRYDYDKAIQLNPDAENRSDSKNDLEGCVEAIAHINRLIQLNPNNAYAYFERGYIKHKLRRYAEAIKDYDKTIELNPNDVYAYHNRGSAKCNLEHYDQAFTDFAKAIQLSPNHSRSYYNQGILKYKLKRYAEAILDFDEAIELNGCWLHLAYSYRGRANQKLGKSAEAKTDFENAKAIELANNSTGSKKFVGADTKPVTNPNPPDQDRVPPVITLTAPVASRGLTVEHVVSTSSVLVVGTVTDDRGKVLLTLNNQPVSLSAGGRFEVPVSLQDGSNPIRLHARDAQNNEATQLLTVQKQAATPTEPKPTPTNESRLALVIGNTAYESITRLGNQPLNDADDMAQVLKRLGFTVITLKDLNRRGLEENISDFTQKLKTYDVGLFFYAGHGLGVDGTNYVLPTDFPKAATKVDFKYSCVAVDWIQDKMAEAGKVNKTNIVIIDACRNNGGLRGVRGDVGESDTWLPPSKIPTGMITCYAASQGEQASNGDKRNGLYTSLLLKHIETPQLLIQQVFQRVRTELLQVGGQQPEEHVKLNKDFYFKLATQPTTPSNKKADTQMMQFQYEELVEKGFTLLDAQAYDEGKEVLEEALKLKPLGNEAKFGIKAIPGLKLYDEAYKETVPNFSESRSYARVLIPAKYDVFTRKVETGVDANGNTIYTTVKDSVLISKSSWTEWREMICRDFSSKVKLTSSKIRKLQQLLKDKNYYYGPINGEMNKFLWIAIWTFETDMKFDSNCTSTNRSEIVLYPQTIVHQNTLKLLNF